MTIAATNVTVIERSRAISTAASDEITRKVSVVASSATRSASSSPAMPARHAAAEPGGRLDPPNRHAEGRGDVAVVGHRPHGRAELA